MSNRSIGLNDDLYRYLLDVSLRVLERSALTSRSLTAEEAALRAREAENVVRFIDRARQVQPRGQVVTSVSVRLPCA